MLKSNSTLLLFFIFIITTTSSCINNDVERDSNDPCKANFIVTQVTGSLSISSEKALPEKFTLDLKTCILSYEKAETKLPHTQWALSRNRKTLKAVKVFNDKRVKKSANLDTDENSIIGINTDGTGCIKWKEEYNYAYNDQSQWILIDRHIKSFSSQHSGICTVPLAVNPWLQLPQYKNMQVADYRKKYEKDSNIIKGRIIEHESGLTYLKQKKEAEQKHKIDIIIDKPKLLIDPSISTKNKTRRVFQNTIEANLTYRIKDIHGNLQDNFINQGDFEITPHLLISSKNNDDNSDNIIEKFIKKNRNEVKVKARFDNNILTSDPFQWIVPLEKHHSRVKLYLKITPLSDTAKRVNPFEGIYSIGNNFSKLFSKNEHGLHLNTILEAKYNNKILGETENIFLDTANPDSSELNECLKNLSSNQSVAECISLDTQPNKYTRGFLTAGWLIGDLQIRFFQMKKENWISREISTLVKTTVSDRAHGKIGNEPINIEIIDLSTGQKEVITKTTENNGNITFNISTRHNWYKKQRYFLKLIRFYTDTKELNVERIIAINPWDYGFTQGYEVNQAQDIRTTCLEKADTRYVKPLLRNGVPISTNQIRTIYKIFCHEPVALYANHRLWINTFNRFKETLKKILSKDSISIQDFFTKFKTSMEFKKPTAHIHLFRAINVYPTYLIDDSLNREIFYNTRFKFSPRVVRHDDVPRGQQNKGPLRDGIYIFQMTVLKNDQGKFNGRGAIVQPRRNFESNSYTNVEKAGVLPLFSCPIDKPNCVTKEDFIILPQNIPIVIRDGMMKVDIRTLIRREHLLFANSKNIMVFRILPADPKSIVCKQGKRVECTMNNPDYINSYESAFDWKKTIKTIKPAPTKYYDMFFYTYQTPFIPSAWSNWNITHEINTDFTEVETLYKNLNSARQVPEKVVPLLSPKAPDLMPNSSPVDDQIIRENHTAELNQMLQTQQQILQTEGLTGNTDAALRQALEQTTTGVQNIPDIQLDERHLSTKAPEPLVDAGVDTHDTLADIQDSDPASEQQTNSQKNPDYCTSVQIGDEQHITAGSRSEECNIKKNTEDLSDKHISYFASQHTLCTMNIHSDKQLSQKDCGHFGSAAEAQQSFLDDLNKQIETINTIKEELNKFDRQKPSPLSAFRHENNTYMDGIKVLLTTPTTPITSSEKPMEEAYIYNHFNSYMFKSKMKKIPKLPFLNLENLETIIQTGIDDTTINNLETGAFLHALCGFWFSDFYSNKYATPDLLLDGFRHAIKKTLYYRLKGIEPPANSEEETDEKIKSLHTGLKELRQHYEDYLKEQRLKGEIDDLYKWLNNHERYGYDSQFHKDLYDKFLTISNAKPLNNEKPSWERQLALTEWFKKLTGAEGEDTTIDNNFYLAYYLREAIAVTEQKPANGIIRRYRDYHPVRKCMMNPSHFFGFEKKTIVGRVGETLQYGYSDGNGGKLTTLSINEDFLMNTQRDQGGNQQFEANISTGLKLLTIPLLALPFFGTLRLAGVAPGIMNLISRKLLNRGARENFTLAALGLLAFDGITFPGTNYSYRGYEGTGKRKLLSIRVSEGVTLKVEQTPITIALEKYQECIVIRPRFSAFEGNTDKYEHIWKMDNESIKSIYKSIGILLCTPGKVPNYPITEDYYYIYPDYNISGITIDPSSHRNKPFIISLRGKKEYRKFKHNLSCYIAESTIHDKTNTDCRDTRGKYEYLLSKYIEFADNLQQGFDTPKMFHLTGDTPGVYSRYETEEDRDIKTDQSTLQKLFNTFNDWQFMDTDVEKIVKREP